MEEVLSKDRKDIVLLRALCASVVIILLVAACSSPPQTLPGYERQKIIAKYYDKLTPYQRQEFLSRKYENDRAAEAALAAYAEKNRREAELFARRTAKLREITAAWRYADNFENAVNTLLTQKKDSPGNLNQRADLEKQYSEVVTRLRNAEDAINHTPFESGQKSELLEQNNDYEKRVVTAKKKLAGK